MRLLARLAAVLLILLVGGCALSVPSDPDGTLDRVRDDGVLRAGASVSPGWVDVSADGRRPVGREPDLVMRFAESLGAEVEWTLGGEEHLVGLLEKGDLDLVVGGLTDQNAWVDKAALTRPFAEERVAGTTEKHVMMVPMGENAWQSELERWLDENAGGR
ncbi:transporter substrate-binding domain-containing protein [Nocardioides caldifontis]|uniref:transporter substrate-binding domain-containing protein n=1 Tax=Nocardioides caldifontis TaxID=2588938 RepID=UPI0011E03A7B|nr:ABC transporter substrate-binding protein [Nocardioides caldifontis]